MMEQNYDQNKNPVLEMVGCSGSWNFINREAQMSATDGKNLTWCLWISSKAAAHLSRLQLKSELDNAVYFVLYFYKC